MAHMFSMAHSFNGPIGDWNVSRVRSMRGMFEDARRFNRVIGSWDVSRVEDLVSVFMDAKSFNSPVSDWNLQSCRSTYLAFSGSGIRHVVAWDQLATSVYAPLNVWRALKVPVLWRRARECHRDAALCESAAEAGRPLELAKRLALGSFAGGIQLAQRGLAKCVSTARNECQSVIESIL